MPSFLIGFIGFQHLDQGANITAVGFYQIAFCVISIITQEDPIFIIAVLVISAIAEILPYNFSIFPLENNLLNNVVVPIVVCVPGYLSLFVLLNRHIIPNIATGNADFIKATVFIPEIEIIVFPSVIRIF